MNDLDSPHDLVGAYVLDALSPEEQRVFEAHLRTCPSCRQEVAQLRPVVDVLPLALDAVEPPAELGARIIAAARADVPGGRPAVLLGGGTPPSQARTWGTSVWLSAAAAVLIVALGLWNLRLQSQMHNMQTADAFRQDVLSAVARGATVSPVAGTPTMPGATAALVQPRGNAPAYLIVRGMPPPPAGKVYEMWFMRSGKAYPAGTFGTGGTGTSVFQLSGPATGSALAAVTMEPGPSGGPTPTGPKVLIGKIKA